MNNWKFNKNTARLFWQRELDMSQKTNQILFEASINISVFAQRKDINNTMNDEKGIITSSKEFLFLHYDVFDGLKSCRQEGIQ